MQNYGRNGSTSLQKFMNCGYFNQLNILILQAICDAIPVGNPTLADTVYEMILGHFMSSSDQKDHEKFYNLVLEWPPTIYNIKNVTTALKRLIAMSTAENATLKEALAKL